MWQKFCLFLMTAWPVLLFAEDTILQLYRPYAQTVKHPPILAEIKLNGACYEQSHYTKRNDSWRCFAAGKMYDPCFTKPFGSQIIVICPESPWVSKATEISTSNSLNNQSHQALDMSQALPWAIELSTGEKCLSVERGESFDGLPLRYHCEHGKQLYGRIQHCSTNWKIFEHNSEGTATVSIAKAWF